MSINDLVVDLVGNKMADANNKFRDLMSARLNDALDARKIELAKSLGETEEEVEITDVEGEEEAVEAEAEEETSEEETEETEDQTDDEAESEEEEETEEDEDVQAV